MEIVLRAALIYVFLFVLTRSLGKATLGEMNVFEAVLLFIVAELVGPAILYDDLSLTGAVVGVSTLALLTALMAWLQRRFPRARRVIEGQPVIIVRDGEMQRTAMSLEGLSETDLLQAARQEGIRDLADVELAVLEVDGSISFFTRQRSESS
jgi:uncharacterized membrane protein YcaP (DUF421 family)